MGQERSEQQERGAEPEPVQPHGAGQGALPSAARYTRTACPGTACPPMAASAGTACAASTASLAPGHPRCCAAVTLLCSIPALQHPCPAASIPALLPRAGSASRSCCQALPLLLGAFFLKGSLCYHTESVLFLDNSPENGVVRISEGR